MTPPFFSKKETDDVYKVLYENYARIMNDYRNLSSSIKIFQRDILTVLNKYPTSEDLKKWEALDRGDWR